MKLLVEINSLYNDYGWLIFQLEHEHYWVSRYNSVNTSGFTAWGKQL